MPAGPIPGVAAPRQKAPWRPEGHTIPIVPDSPDFPVLPWAKLAGWMARLARKSAYGNPDGAALLHGFLPDPPHRLFLRAWLGIRAPLVDFKVNLSFSPEAQLKKHTPGRLNRSSRKGLQDLFGRNSGENVFLNLRTEGQFGIPRLPGLRVGALGKRQGKIVCDPLEIPVLRGAQLAPCGECDAKCSSTHAEGDPQSVLHTKERPKHFQPPATVKALRKRSAALE